MKELSTKGYNVRNEEDVLFKAFRWIWGNDNEKPQGDFFFCFFMTCRYRIAPVDIPEIPASGTVDYDHVQNKNKVSPRNAPLSLVVVKG